MKKLLALLGLVFLIFPSFSSAHTADQLPIIKVNGAYAKIYTVGSTSLSDLILPQDASPANYLVNEKLDFELDTNNLPILPEFIPQLTITWKFGDGASSTGFKQSHSYAKMGSYIIEIYSQNPGDGGQPQLLDSILLNILPTADYKLPSALPKMNGEHPDNPYTTLVKADFTKDIPADATSSSAGSSPITSYTWDFGDHQSSHEAKVMHRFDQQFSSALIMLRVVDSNGFLSDALIQLENTTLDQNAVSTTPKTTSINKKAYQKPAFWFAIASGLLVITGISYIIISSRRGRQESDNVVK